MLTQEQQIFEQINKANNILITFSRNWIGDGVASALALFLFLKKIDKKVNIVAEKNDSKKSGDYDENKSYSFLPAYDNIKNHADNLRKFIISLNITDSKVSQIKYNINEKENKLNFIISPKEGFFTHDDIESSTSGFKYDLIITLDSPDLESLGKIYDNDTEFFYKTPIINIDHHGDNEEFGQINYIELTAVSTSEILFSLLENYSRELIDDRIATCLLAGIISKTKSFKTSNITPKTLLTTSQLISIGADREKIVNKLYRSKNLNVLKLWGRVLARLNSDLNNTLVWSTLTKIDFIKTDSKIKDLRDVIEELIVNIPQAKIIVLIFEKLDLEDKHVQTEFIVYSTKTINSLDLIKEFNPIGTKKMAKATLNKPVLEASDKIIKKIKEKLKKLPV